MDIMIYEMDMPVCFGRDQAKIYGDIAESLVYDIFREHDIELEFTAYECPIDFIIQGQWGAEVKFRRPNRDRKILSFKRTTRIHKLKFCKDNGLKPLTILVLPIAHEQVKIYIKKGIKNISKGYEGISLEDFINAMDNR